jgi:DnaJ-class molecular chaperone
VKNLKNYDFYKILGLNPDTNQEELRKAYIKLALTYHPDRCQGDKSSEERFKAISQAYAILRDPLARSRYDRLRSSKTKNNPQTANYQNQKPGSEKPPEKAQAKSPEKTQTFTKTASFKTEPKKEQPKEKEKQNFSETFDNTYKSTNTSDIPPKNQTKDQAKENNPDLEDILENYFKSPDGKNSIKKLEEELTRLGLSFNFDTLVRQLKGVVRKPSFFNSLKLSFTKGLDFTRKIWKKTFKSDHSLSPQDLVFTISLTKEAADSGTELNISYIRDDLVRELKVKIPPQLKNKSRLRLPKEGNLKPDQSRGDVFLIITIRDNSQ